MLVRNKIFRDGELSTLEKFSVPPPFKQVTIWDVDFYYADILDKKVNPIATRISSWHKQLGDKVNFVRTNDDIRRPYDYYYIIRENINTPHVPAYFYKERWNKQHPIYWIGKASQSLANFNEPLSRMACRPDYELYPEGTPGRTNQLRRLFDNCGHYLELTQDYHNVYRGKKYTIDTDHTKSMWQLSLDSDLEKALDFRSSCKNLSFLEPISLERVRSNENIQRKIKKLPFIRGSNIGFTDTDINCFDKTIEFLNSFKGVYSACKIQKLPLTLPYTINSEKIAWQAYKTLIKLIVQAKKEKIDISLKLDYSENFGGLLFLVLDELERFTNNSSHDSWINFLAFECGGIRWEDAVIYWSNPSHWSDKFRQLLRLTWKNKDFMLSTWGENRTNEIYIPWAELEKEFKYGI